MIYKESRNSLRKRRHMRLRKKLKGTMERPRLSVYRSLKHIYAQVIDDETGKTIVAASSLEKSFIEKNEKGTLKEMAKKVGLYLAEKAKTAGITKIVFDRGGYKFHGRIAALAEGLREAGMDF
jgi:large subunit ribosomal protein L18